MQSRYSVIAYHPGFAITRHRDEYRNAGLEEFVHVYVVKEVRPDGRHRWQKDGTSFENFYSVMFSQGERKVCSVVTDHRIDHTDGALDSNDKEFRGIADEVLNFFSQLSTTTVNRSEVS
ncbi:hypothetical protein [uncultured Corynebacterium sp.]|uniref:hypothetical protein n=1 Tax=uncultured Corynebacterium sp. TaxID=159447 RepID=UPI002627844F|nr:hypothetical protein [uncultured Corynebacterium sp.]